jgi:ribosomal-protein-alanine N-acetyltransferase
MLTIYGKRLSLRDWRIDEIGTFYAWESDAEIMKHVSWRSLSQAESMAHLVDAVKQGADPARKRYFLAVEIKESGTFVGDAGFTILSDTGTGGIADLGYFLRKEEWGYGYGTEAAGILISFIFERTHLHKVIACCSRENTASEKVMLKCGMKKEAERRMGRLQQGTWCDGLEYGILREEWQRYPGKQTITVISS